MVRRLGISLDEELVARFDRRIEARGYENRSEAIRDLIRNALVEEAWRGGASGDRVAVVTLVYDHDSHALAQRLTHVQHEHFGAVVASLHVHLDEHNCLEVLILRGRGDEILRMGEALVATRGVKHGRVVPATTGKEVV